MTAASIMSDPSEIELARKVEENLYDLFRAMSAPLGGELDEHAHFSRYHTFPTSPMFKGAWATGLTKADADAAVADTIDWFRSRNVPYAFWWTTSFTQPDDFGTRLRARGILPYDKDVPDGVPPGSVGAPAMVATLDQLNEAALTTVPDGFSIDVVADAAALEDFKRV